MRALWVLLLLGGAIQATPITTANPVPIDGSGWSLISDHHSSDLSVTASGSNGIDFVNFTFTTADDWGIAPYFCVCAGFSVNVIGTSATIDGVTGPWMDFSIWNGAGHINVYGFTHSIIASADLIGFVEVTSQSNGLMPGDTHRTFSISSTDSIAAVPEPATWFAGIPLLIAALHRKFWMLRTLWERSQPTRSA